jgi:HK97 family phage major capsid protein
MRRTQAYEGLDVVRAGTLGREDMIGRAKAAVDTAPAHLRDDSREKITAMLEAEGKQAPLIARHMLLTGSPEYHQQFREYVQSRGTYAGEAMRAALSLTNANGGYLVPFTLDPTVILTNSGIQGSMRSISTIKTIATDDWNGVTSAGVTAEWLGEGVQAADATPTFGQPTITPKKAAAWVFGSYEVLADSGFASDLQMLLADAKVRLEETAFATANTGASQPRGIVAATAAVTASIVTSATTGAFVVADVYSLANALRPRDSAEASWIANKAIFNKIRQFDTAGGGGFWANLGMGRPNELLGQAVYEASPMTSTVGNGTNILLAGNFKQYYIVDRVGMSVMYEPMVKSTGNGRPTGQAGWFAFWRVGADVVDADAFRLLQLNQVAAATALA